MFKKLLVAVAICSTLSGLALAESLIFSIRVQDSVSYAMIDKAAVAVKIKHDGIVESKSARTDKGFTRIEFNVPAGTKGTYQVNSGRYGYNGAVISGAFVVNFSCPTVINRGILLAPKGL